MKCLSIPTITLLLYGVLAIQPCSGDNNTTDRKESNASSLWLDYQPIAPARRSECSAVVKLVCCPGQSPILLHARDELVDAANHLLDVKVPTVDSISGDGTVLIGTPGQLKDFLPEETARKAAALKPGGYLIKSANIDGRRTTIIVSPDDAGVLYGTFHFIRLMQTGAPVTSLDLVSEPAISIRMLNHWDNLNGSIERGYAGRSLWKWDELPGEVNNRCHQYARYCASIGINAVALNNVNADPRILRADYLSKVAALADVFRTWGIRTYLSANFAAPMHPSATPEKMKNWGGIGNLDTADPLDPAVREWWKRKTAEIYALIPDFGGFLVKADSEGMKGPKTYGRTHVEGATMLADALAPHGGTLIWRAFVYGHSKDRAMDAYNEFTPFDGKFRDNVFIQVKNGPLDFQPHEAFNPLFGSMPHTLLAMELQVTKEYLGRATTLAYLGPMWSRILGSDTYAKGPGSTIAKVIDGSLHGQKTSCIAGVANTGDGPEWCGSIFNQANWYAFGRLAWDPSLSPETIADEWIDMTLHSDPDTRLVIRKMMMGSYDAMVDYKTPLGLNFLVAQGDHYTPDPANRKSYHMADATGLGFDRTKKGSNYAGQYHPPLSDIFNDPDKTPMDLLLWFHHVPWDAKLSTGRTLWQELQFRYNGGVEAVDRMEDTWKTLEGKVDPAIHASVMKRLQAEQKFSRLWRDHCLNYFASFANPGTVGH